ncbi:MAG: hypothetical protein LKF75_02420 [Bacilli bacterium]|jgi:chorismate synthase|nr:hypothetical protein [Bacilli bacterium]MCH4210585.1 hypothetical protein [Bacilli bacterium]MCH4228543.1 hypothetical protein [Bacilli bacterium]MCH4277321.1 hypothetical protein [Bacilli bacterium]MCI2055233.1 hypothetical protein [Bacilli bacterium]
MKDKLEKTGHKKFYYELKSALAIFMFVMALFALAAIPVGITFKLSEAKGKEETEPSTSLVSETQHSENVPLLS